MYSGKIAVPPGGGGIVEKQKQHTTYPKVITKLKINTITASAQSGPHSFASITVPTARDSV
jgi:hypothetical protein